MLHHFFLEYVSYKFNYNRQMLQINNYFQNQVII